MDIDLKIISRVESITYGGDGVMNPSITPRLKSRGIYKGHTKRRPLTRTAK